MHHRIREMPISLAVPDIPVARARAGDLEALEALYRAFETPVYNLARRMLRHPEEAEDVLQETFLEVVKSIRSYRGEGPLWAWIRKIAASKALDRKSTRLNSSHLVISYAVFCLKKKKKKNVVTRNQRKCKHDDSTGDVYQM